MSDEIFGGATLGSQHGTIGNSFASVVQAKNNKKVVKIKELRNEAVVEGEAVAIPFEAVEEVKSRFSNTLYGFFIGKRLAFPLVENYVKNTWAKYGLKRVQLHDDFFLFQFESKEGMERVLEDGPWIIRTVPLILNVWSPNTDLKKAEIKKAVWIKLHHVPIVAYSEIRLSLITTQIGKPITLDSYTSNMCLSSWGKSTYARALIEVSAENELLDSVVIAIPVHKDKGHTLATIDIEYEWNPPRCATCLIFDHHTDKCPKLPKPTYVENVNGDGFVEVKKKKNKNKNRQNKVAGVRLSKPQPQLHYRRVEKGDSSKKVHSDTSQIPEIRVSNSFGILDDDKGEESSSLKNEDVLNISGNDIDEEIHVGRDDKEAENSRPYSGVGYFIFAWCGMLVMVKGLAGLNASNPNIYDIIQDLLPIVKHRTTVSVIAKLVVAASPYYVWQERNWRLFKKGKRSSDQIVECIVSSVRLKLLSCKLKKSKSGERMARLWDHPEVVFT
uniref:DUF4283 domain-containing protein n=1 Tax=Tanacetum cinerariifolium TaxID=118510 RepID=A0A6L2K1L9_TANCI|nr:hypothetical protein [Tanacetum cinerariifolium]